MFPKLLYLNLEKEDDFPLYRKRSVEQNRENSIYLSIGILATYLLINLIWNVFDLSTNFPQEKYFARNLRIITIIALLNLVYNFLCDKFIFLKKELVTQTVIVTISISILYLSSINSFVISLDPKNNLTPILVGAIAIAALFKFNMLESIVVFVCGLVFFSSLFLVWKNTQVSFALNFSAIFNIYLLAFIINRRIFKSAYEYFKQLRITELVNLNLKNALQHKEEVLAIVAHDLRGPIGNIKYISEILAKEELTEEERKNNISLIYSSCISANATINDIIKISKIKNNSENLVIVNLDEILRSIHSNFTANLKRQILITSSNENKYAQIYKEKFYRIINNLLSNAVKFTPEDKNIEIKVSSTTSYHIIEIIDEGIGISTQDQPQLFKKYTELSRQGLNGEESIGLGLYIVKELTEMMNGTISYKVNEKGGSIFILKMPKA